MLFPRLSRLEVRSSGNKLTTEVHCQNNLSKLLLQSLQKCNRLFQFHHCSDDKNTYSCRNFYSRNRMKFFNFFVLVPTVRSFVPVIKYPNECKTASASIMELLRIRRQRPLYTRTDLQYTIYPFLMCLPTKSIFSALYK